MSTESNSTPAPIFKSKHPLYKIWRGMHDRCYNTNCQNYRNYGGRGLTISDEWRTDFWAFARDIGDRPSTAHSVDRIDNSLGYSPKNCRWATVTEQARNRRDNQLLTYNGETKCLSEWAQSCGLTAGTVHTRLRMGWDIDLVLSRPVRHHEPKSGELHYVHGAKCQKADLTGQVYGRLTVIGATPRKGASPNARWLCECVCGNTKDVLSHNLRAGRSLSCGCGQRGKKPYTYAPHYNIKTGAEAQGATPI